MNKIADVLRLNGLHEMPARRRDKGRYRSLNNFGNSDAIAVIALAENEDAFQSAQKNL